MITVQKTQKNILNSFNNMKHKHKNIKKKGIKISTQKDNTKQQSHKKISGILSQKNQRKSTIAKLNIEPRNKLRLPLGKIKRSPNSLSQTRNKPNKRQGKREKN
jgi:hypothetical protein